MIENILIITCVSILFFWKTLKYNYVSDDIPVYNKTKDQYKDCWWKRIFWQLEGSIRVSQKQDHVLTMLIHTLVCVMIYIAFGKSQVSFVAALLFCVNPITNQGSVWISGRGYVLPTLYLLCALALPFASPIFLYAATYFNAGFLAPVLFIFSPVKWILLFMPLIWFLRYKIFSANVKDKISKEMFDADKKIHWRKLVLFFKTFGYYLTLSVIPFRCSFYHAFLQSAAGNKLMHDRAMSMDKFFFIGITTYLSFTYYLFTHPVNILTLALAWILVTLSPFCNLFRVSQEIAERYAYMPTVGTMVALSAILCNWCPILIPFFLGMYGMKLWDYMDAYQDDYYLTEVACVNSRNAWFAWHVRAMKRWEVGSYKEALTMWVMAKLISPDEFKILFNISTALILVNNKKESEEYLEKAIANIPAGQEKQLEKILNDRKEGKYAVLL